MCLLFAQTWKKLKTKKCQRDTKRQLLCCIKYRFLTYLIITRSNISSSYDGGMRWDETWEKRERKTLCNGVFVSVCEQRDAIWSLLVERMFARNTSMRVSVCVFAMAHKSCTYYIKGRKRNTYTFTNAFWWIKFQIKFRTTIYRKDTDWSVCVCVCESDQWAFFVFAVIAKHKFNFPLHQTFCNCYFNCLASEEKKTFFASIGWKFELMLFTWNLKKWHIIWKGAIWPMDICKRSKKSLNMFRMTFDKNRTKLLFTKEIWPIFPYDISGDRPLWPQ